MQCEHPTEEGWLLAAEGSLTQAGLHEQKFWSGAANEHHHHHVDVDCKPDDSHHGDQDDQDVDQNDDKQDPICIEDDVDDDDENDNHQAIDLQNDDVDNDNETSRKCLPNPRFPPVSPPTQLSQRYLIGSNPVVLWPHAVRLIT